MTMTTSLYLFVSGAATMGFATAGLFFFRFWNRTRDRLFAIFGWAFWVLAFERIVIVLLGKQGSAETRSLVYVMRLAAFIVILLGVIDKNRPAAKP